MSSQIQKIAVPFKAILARRAIQIPLQVVLISTAVALAIISLPDSHAPIDTAAFNWAEIFGGLSFYVIFYLVFAVHWAYALSIIENKKIHFGQILAFFSSQPYKYFPTSIFSFSARSVYSRKAGAESLVATAKAQLVEYGSIFASGLIVIALAKAGVSAITLIASGLVACTYLLYEKLYVNRKRGRVYKYLILVLISTIGWLIAGISFYFVVQGVGDVVSYKQSLFINTAAYLASIAAIFVPAGIGIREAILFSQNVGFVGTLSWRICSIVIDIVSGIVAIISINKKTK